MREVGVGLAVVSMVLVIGLIALGLVVDDEFNGELYPAVEVSPPAGVYDEYEVPEFDERWT